MKLINLTPHQLNIFDRDGVEIVVPRTEYSEGRYLVLRVEQVSKVVNCIGTIEIVLSSYGQLEFGTIDEDGNNFVEVPTPSFDKDANIFVVSMLCLQSFNTCLLDTGSWRLPLVEFAGIKISKFFAPGSLIRKDGKPIGCKGLSKI